MQKKNLATCHRVGRRQKAGVQRWGRGTHIPPKPGHRDDKRNKCMMWKTIKIILPMYI